MCVASSSIQVNLMNGERISNDVGNVLNSTSVPTLGRLKSRAEAKETLIGNKYRKQFGDAVSDLVDYV